MRNPSHRITLTLLSLSLAILIAALLSGGCGGSPTEQADRARAYATFDSTMIAGYSMYEVVGVNGTTFRLKGHALIARDSWGNSSWEIIDHHANTLATGGAGTTARQVQEVKR